jgi:hypothetical protein
LHVDKHEILAETVQRRARVDLADDWELCSENRGDELAVEMLAGSGDDVELLVI